MSAEQAKQRSVPMEVLVLGVGRTGTQSIAEALTLLGYNKTYHMKEVFMRGDYPFWIAAMDAKYEGKGKRFGLEEFDEFLGEYMAVTDYPAAMFPDELIASYPRAKVVLSIRDEDAWVKSFQETILHRWNAEKQARELDNEPQPEFAESGSRPRGLTRNEMVQKLLTHSWNDDFEANGRRTFREHNKHVRDLMKDRPDDFLEYNVAEGWESLCRFLGKEVPAQPFPRSDAWAKYKEMVARGEKPLDW